MHRLASSLGLFIVASAVILAATPAQAVNPYCTPASDECECINQGLCQGTIYYSARLSIWPETPPMTWNIRVVPPPSDTVFISGITTQTLATEWNTCMSQWRIASSLIPTDNVTINPFDYYFGHWDVDWIGCKELRTLLSNSRAVSLTGVDRICPVDGSTFYITNAYTLFAWDPYLVDPQFGTRIQYTWHDFATNIPARMLDIRAASSHEYGHSLGFAEYSGTNPVRSVMYDDLLDPNHKLYVTDSPCEMSAVARLYRDASIDAMVDWFRVEPLAGAVRVRWHATFEREVARYLVERAETRFGSFNWVGSADPNGSQAYDFVDAAHASGYYRLRELLPGAVCR